MHQRKTGASDRNLHFDYEGELCQGIAVDKSKKLKPKREFRILDWAVHPDLNVIKSSVCEVQLEPRVMEVLTCLAAQPGGVVSKEDLIHEVWNGAIVTDEVLTNAIWELRKALRDDAKNPRYVQTIPKRGYRLIAPVRLTVNDNKPNLSAHDSVVAVFHRHSKFVLLLGLLLAFAVLTAAFNFSDLRHRIMGSLGPPRIESLAVLPLRNVSGDPNQEYLVDGMTESLIARFAKVDSLRVISRTSTMKYKDSKKDLAEIVRELSVDAIVEGSVLHANGKVRITGQLIQASTNRLLWAETYERDLRDVIALQNQVTHAIVDGIQHTLTQSQRTRLSGKPVANPDAYQAYLQGRYYYWKFESSETTDKAIRYFERALALEPDFALAHLGLADCYTMRALQGNLLPKDVYPLAKQAAETALTLDPNLGEAYATLSHISMFYDWDWAGAKKAWEKALALSPSERKARTARLNYLVAIGEFDEAFREQDEIMKLDAVRPVNDRNYGLICSFARQYARANTYFEKSLEFYDVADVRLWIASNLAYDGKFTEARKALVPALDMHPLFRESSFDLHVAFIYAFTGDRQESLRILEYWEKRADLTELSPSGMAKVHMGLGNKTLALDFLEKAFERRCPSLTHLKVNPVYDSLRTEPRFQDMVERMNFPSTL